MSPKLTQAPQIGNPAERMYATLQDSTGLGNETPLWATCEAFFCKLQNDCAAWWI